LARPKEAKVQATVRSWVGSPAGRWLTPLGSLLLIVAGAVVLGTSLLGEAERPAPPPADAATGDLETAMAAAKEYLVGAKPNSYRGFGPAQAEPMAPSIVWNKSASARTGEVSIRIGGRTEIVLATKDEADRVYCIADVNADEHVTRGTVDAKKPAECTGGW
jgi:hypothetical protein